MLQVLVSIQGLVLVDKPYYNEAGYEKQVGSEEGWAVYFRTTTNTLYKITRAFNSSVLSRSHPIESACFPSVKP